MSEDRSEFWHFERRGWEKAAPNYQACWSGLTTQFIDPLLKAIGIRPGMRVLDVACGPGFVSEAVWRLGANTVGLDFTVAMIDLATRRCPQLDFRQGDAQELGLPDESFDAVAMNFGVNHLADPDTAFAEARRVLKRGGRYGFTVWAKPEQNPGVRIMHEAVEKHADLSVPIPEGPSGFRFAERDECRRTLETAGFAPSSLTFEMLQVGWSIPRASFFLEAERTAGVRTAALLARQSEERLVAIESELQRGVEAYATADGFTLPMAAYVVAASSNPHDL